MKKAIQKIALLHHAGGGNLGDDAILDAVIENLRARRPDASIAAFSMNPADTSERHGIPAYPIRSFNWSLGYAAAKVAPVPASRLAAAKGKLLRKLNRLSSEAAFWILSFRRLRGFDLLVVSGGGQLTERSGPWGFPYALFVWSRMAKLAGVRLIYLNIGAGPLRHPLSRFFVASGLSAAAYVSFRDQPSKDLAVEVGYKGPSEVCPDNVYSARFAAPHPAVRTSERLTIGLAPMSYPYCDPREHPAEDLRSIYDDFLAKLAAFAECAHRQSISVQLFGSDIGTDPSAIQDLHDVLLKRYQLEVPSTAPVHSLQDLLREMSGMDIVVTCRYHGVVLAHLLNKPVLAIAHHPKVTALMDALGLSEYCFDIRSFGASQLTDKLASLLERRDEIKAQMAKALVTFRREIDRQFDALFSPSADSQPAMIQSPAIANAAPGTLPQS